jgi:hypothetical protein
MNLRVLIAVFLIPSLVFAQSPPIEAVPPGEDKIVVVREGEKVPFAGQLYDGPTALRWANWLEQYRFRLRVDVEVEKSKGEVEKTYVKSLMQIEKDKNEVIQKDLRERLARSEQARLVAEEEARNPPWYKTREFGLILGVVGTAAAVGLSVWALEARK